jgi:hypothetical protein
MASGTERAATAASGPAATDAAASGHAATSAAAESVPADGVRVPLACFQCATELQVPLTQWRAGNVQRCPRCRAMIVTTAAMHDAVRAVVDAAQADGCAASALEERLRSALARLRPPGAPVPRRTPFAF